MTDKPIHEMMEELVFVCNQCGKFITMFTAENHFEKNADCNTASARRVIQHERGKAYFPKGSMN